MFYIDQSTKQFQQARDEHYRNIRYIIKKKLMGKHFKEAHPTKLSQRINQVKGIHSGVAAFLNDENNLRDVLIGTPDVLDKIKLKFSTKKTKASIKALINYDAFTETESDKTFRFYHGYNLAEKLDIQTCIYCNRLYTHTIITEKRKFIARATFDHWFPKATYPLLALSFYNLIPSCNVCNSSVKGSDLLALKSIFHPYWKHKSPKKQLDFNFAYDLEDHVKAVSVLEHRNKFSGDSLEAMQLDIIYKSHNQEIRELIYLKKAFSSSYLRSVESILKKPLSTEEVYRLAFGVYLEDEHLIKRPLSKLKKDILTKLGIIS